MKKLLILPLLILSASLAFAGSCDGKDCSKDKKEDKSGAFVETSTFAGGCGSCSGDKKDKKEKKDTKESGFTTESTSLVAGAGCGSCSGDKKDKKEKKTDEGFTAESGSLLAGAGCGSCSGDKKDKKEKKDTKESGFSATYSALA